MRLSDMRSCTGCMACLNSCNYNAIEMVQDVRGFYKPHINEAVCVACNSCQNTCPVLNKNVMYPVKNCFLAYGIDDELRKKSSSGGIMSIISRAVIRKGGVVCGAEWAEGFGKVRHVIADDEEKADAFCQSKYVQSDLGYSYQKVKEYLEKGICVLFTGLSCQIAGLNNYLGKMYDNLYTIDMICRGNSSVKVLNKYIEWQKKEDGGDKISVVEQRSKRKYFVRPTLYIEYDNGKSNYMWEYENAYFNAFSRNYSINTACFNCQYKGNNRVADITVGDAQGAEFLYPHIYGRRAMSHVMVNTDRGQELFDYIADEVYRERIPLKNISFVDKKMNESVTPPENIDEFWKDFETESFGIIAEKYLRGTQRNYVDIDDDFSYRKEFEAKAGYKCAYGVGNTFKCLVEGGHLQFDYCTDGNAELTGESICGVKYIPLQKMLNRDDIFVIITVFDYMSVKEIHDLLVNNDIPHKLFMDGEEYGKI